MASTSAQLPRLLQRRQQLQQALALGLIVRVQRDLRAHGGGQQHGSRQWWDTPPRWFRLLHDLSRRAHQPHDAVLLPGQRVAALLHLDQQGIRQLPLDAGVFDLNIGQGIGNVPDHLILVQQKEIVAVRYAAGLDGSPPPYTASPR